MLCAISRRSGAAPSRSEAYEARLTSRSHTPGQFITDIAQDQLGHDCSYPVVRDQYVRERRPFEIMGRCAEPILASRRQFALGPIDHRPTLVRVARLPSCFSCIRLCLWRALLERQPSWQRGACQPRPQSEEIQPETTATSQHAYEIRIGSAT
jgi:hypothetical protein